MTASEDNLFSLIKDNQPLDRVQRAISQSGCYYKDSSLETRPALHLAVQCGLESVVRLLLDHGADINELDKGLTAVQYSVLCLQKECLATLIARNADVNKHVPGCNPPLVYALVSSLFQRDNDRFSDLQFLEKQCSQLCRVKATDYIGCTEESLSLANEYVSILLRAGANVNAVNCFKQPALWIAISFRNSKAIDSLIQYQANFSCCQLNQTQSLLVYRSKFRGEMYGPLHLHSPLHLAVCYRNPDAAERLLKAGASISNKCACKNTICFLSILLSYKQNDIVDEIPALVNLMVRYGLDVLCMDGDKSVLERALYIYSRDYSKVKAYPIVIRSFMNAGVEINRFMGSPSNISGNVQNTALYHTGLTWFHDNRQTKLNQSDQLKIQVGRQSGLEQALQGSFYKRVQWLLDLNADVDMFDQRSRNLLHRVVIGEQEEGWGE